MGLKTNYTGTKHTDIWPEESWAKKLGYCSLQVPSCVLGTSILLLGLRKSLSLYALNMQMSDMTQYLKLKSGCHCKYRSSALQLMAEVGNNYSNHCWIAGMCQEQPC